MAGSGECCRAVSLVAKVLACRLQITGKKRIIIRIAGLVTWRRILDQEEIFHFICQELPHQHLDTIIESVEVALHESGKHLQSAYQEVPLVGPGPQSHHFMVQEALLRLAKNAGLSVSSQPTKPAGGHYALINSGTLKITTSIIAVDRPFPVRKAGFRQLLRQENAWLQALPQDLFNPPAQPLGPSESSLHALLLPCVDKWSSSGHGRLLGCIIAIPFSNSSAYHLWADVNDLRRHYDADGSEIEDIAYPTLRDRMRGAETEDGEKEVR